MFSGEQAGYDDVVEELREIQVSHQYWIEYALEQSNTVQQVATRFDGRRMFQTMSCWRDSHAGMSSPRRNARQTASLNTYSDASLSSPS